MTAARTLGARPGRRGRWSVLALGGVALTLALLLLPASAAGAGSGPTATKTLRPPYVHALPFTFRETATSFCSATAGFSSPPTASPRTGNVSISAFSRAAGCGNQYAQSTADGSVGFTGINYTARSGAPLNITFTWTLSWSARLSASPGVGASPYNAYAYVQIYQQEFVYDLVTGYTAGYAVQNVWSNFTYNGSISTVVHGNLSVASTVFTPTPGHVYAMQPNVWVFVSAFADPGATAAATVDMSTSGFGGELTQIVVS